MSDEQIKIHVRCKGLKLQKNHQSCQIQMYIQDDKKSWVLNQQTEMAPANESLKFKDTFVITFKFNEQQSIKIRAISWENEQSSNYTVIGEAETTLAALFGSRSHSQVLELFLQKTMNGQIKLKTENYKQGSQKSITLQFEGKNLKNTRWWFGKTISPFLRFYKYTTGADFKQSSILAYETEYCYHTTNPKFKPFEVKTNIFCNDDFSTPILVELRDKKKQENVLLGSLEISVNDMKKLKILKFSKDHIINLVSFQKDKAYCISDYICSGWQLVIILSKNLITAIDFGILNLEKTNKKSLHFLESNLDFNSIQIQNNQYIKAMKQIGEILVNYDHDHQVPMFGFSGKTPENTQNLFKMSQKEAIGVNGMVQQYIDSLKHVSQNQITCFGKLFQEILTTCQEIHKQRYIILMVLTQGNIGDMQAAERYLKELSSYPVSVVILGIGNSKFQKMQTLNDINFSRQIVSFFPFKDNSKSLAQVVLTEISKQFTEYTKLNGVIPRKRRDSQRKSQSDKKSQIKHKLQNVFKFINDINKDKNGGKNQKIIDKDQFSLKNEYSSKIQNQDKYTKDKNTQNKQTQDKDTQNKQTQDKQTKDKQSRYSQKSPILSHSRKSIPIVSDFEEQIIKKSLGKRSLANAFWNRSSMSLVGSERKSLVQN